MGTGPTTLTGWASSDWHGGPAGDPATDYTPGTAEAWAALPGDKWLVGDISDDVQFGRYVADRAVGIERIIANRNGRLCCGNHDPEVGEDELMVGDTLFLHGDQLDPWLMRLADTPIVRLCYRLERWWSDADTRLEQGLRRLTRSGRYATEPERWHDYVVKASRRARERGARQVVFGHLHCAPFGTVWRGVRVINIGCCVNGRMDFVPVDIITADDAERE